MYVYMMWKEVKAGNVASPLLLGKDTTVTEALSHETDKDFRRNNNSRCVEMTTLAFSSFGSSTEKSKKHFC